MRRRLGTSGICEEGCSQLLRDFWDPRVPQQSYANFAAHLNEESTGTGG